MKQKLKRALKNYRIIILLIAIALSILAIRPDPNPEGATIRAITENTSASIAGLVSPPENSAPMNKEVIIAIDNKKIATIDDYYAATEGLPPGRTLRITTNSRTYTLVTRALTETIVLAEVEEYKINETYSVNMSVNGSIVPVNKTREVVLSRNKTETLDLGTQDLGIKVTEAPTTNIVKGLDLAGGTRVLLRPDEDISEDTMSILIDNMKQRLNIYGLSDLVVRPTKDLSGNQFIVVEIAGANEEEVKDLISRQGKFEAKIADEIIFTGGERDITYVCRTAQCSGIDPFSGCGEMAGGGYVCGFRFSINLKPEAAEKMARATDKLDILTTDDDGNPVGADDRYLSEEIILFLDDEEVDRLNIGADLKGRAVTDIQISGSGLGNIEQEAARNALDNMKQLQTIMITGSLPTTLTIEKIDNLSPVLGREFLKNALLIGITSILAVALVVYIRFRKLTVTIPMIITMCSEVILLLGTAALIGWNIDLAAIAGIIIAVGTGVDHQIIIADEVLSGVKDRFSSWKNRIKKAFFIIMAAYFTTLVAMIPLYSAGAGLLRGFAITTILGVSYGVFITRPAFAAMMEIFGQE